MAQLPRGVRNANPGNIEYDPNTKWQGLAKPPTDGRFCRFEAPKWGIRALARVLISYQDKHGLRTVRGIINRWAPPSENNTDAYVRSVAKAVGVGPDDAISVHEYAFAEPLVKAIIRHENGQQPYDKATIDEGLKLAGINPPLKPAVADGQVAGGAVAVVSGGAVVAEAVNIGNSARGFLESQSLILVAVGVVVLAVGGFFLWRRLRTRKIEA